MKSPKVAKTRQKSPAKQARDLSIRADAAAGAKTSELAEKYGLKRHQVSNILSGEEVKRLVKEGESRFTLLVDKAIKKVEAALDQDFDLTNGLKAAITVLKSVGVAKDRMDIAHSYPKPLVIKRRNGKDEVIAGTTADIEKERTHDGDQ